MRTRVLLALVGATCLSAPGVALAQKVSGDIAVVSLYIDDDGFDYSYGPAVQATVDITLGDFTTGVWASKTLDGDDGDEFDFRLAYTKKLSEHTELTGEVAYFVLKGDDIIKLEASLAHETPIGNVDFKAGRYVWTNGDNQNATRLQFGFSPTVSDSFDLRLYVTRETGFGLDPIVTAGVSAEYHLNERFSLTANLVAPVSKHNDDPRATQDDPRATQFAVGVRASF